MPLVSVDPHDTLAIDLDAANAQEAEEILASLLDFDVDLCSMYDPNEEAKVRRVIYAVGEEEFNERMQNLERDVFAQREELARVHG